MQVCDSSIRQPISLSRDRCKKQASDGRKKIHFAMKPENDTARRPEKSGRSLKACTKTRLAVNFHEETRLLDKLQVQSYGRWGRNDQTKGHPRAVN
jgi:hypothetical protein